MCQECPDRPVVATKESLRALSCHSPIQWPSRRLGLIRAGWRAAKAIGGLEEEATESLLQIKRGATARSEVRIPALQSMDQKILHVSHLPGGDERDQACRRRTTDRFIYRYERGPCLLVLKRRSSQFLSLGVFLCASVVSYSPISTSPEVSLDVGAPPLRFFIESLLRRGADT